MRRPPPPAALCNKSAGTLWLHLAWASALLSSHSAHRRLTAIITQRGGERLSGGPVGASMINAGQADTALAQGVSCRRLSRPAQGLSGSRFSSRSVRNERKHLLGTGQYRVSTATVLHVHSAELTASPQNSHTGAQHQPSALQQRGVQSWSFGRAGLTTKFCRSSIACGAASPNPSCIAWRPFQVG